MVIGVASVLGKRRWRPELSGILHLKTYLSQSHSLGLQCVVQKRCVREIIETLGGNC